MLRLELGPGLGGEFQCDLGIGLWAVEERLDRVEAVVLEAEDGMDSG